jgi:hypothetical protein
LRREKREEKSRSRLTNFFRKKNMYRKEGAHKLFSGKIGSAKICK